MLERTELTSFWAAGSERAPFLGSPGSTDLLGKATWNRELTSRSRIRLRPRDTSRMFRAAANCSRAPDFARVPLSAGAPGGASAGARGLGDDGQQQHGGSAPSRSGSWRHPLLLK